VNKLRRVFCPTPEEEREDFRNLAAIIRNNIKNRVCGTCVHYITVPGYHPGFVTGADEDCDTGRCPIATCEEYKLNPEELDNLHEAERLGWR